MKGELKAGGLALVLYPSEHSGKMVILVELVQPMGAYKNPLTGNQEFMHPQVDFASWVATGDVWPLFCENERGWALFSPSVLQPIDDADPDAVDENIYFIPIKCEVC